MQVLPDGSIQIRNKKTGETKIIKPEELGNYGLSNSDYATQLEAQKKIEQIQSGQPEPDATLQREKEKKLSEQKQLAGDLRQFSESFKGVEGLAKGALGVTEEQTGKGWLGKIFGIDMEGALGKQMFPKAAAFDSDRNSLAYAMASAIANQTGRGISDEDVKIFRDTLPGRSDSDKSAELKVQSAVKKLERRLKDSGISDTEIGGILQGITTRGGEGSNPLANILTKPFYNPEQKNQLEEKLGGVVGEQAPFINNLISMLTDKPAKVDNPSVGGFIQNVGNEIGGMAQGLVKSAPALGAEVAGFNPLMSLLTGNKNTITQRPQGELTGQALTTIPASMIGLSQQLGSDPAAAFYNKPVSQTLNSVALAKMLNPGISKIRPDIRLNKRGGSVENLGGVSEQDALKQLNQAFYKSDYKRVGDILNTIPDEAPFKENMVKIFGQYTKPQGTTGNTAIDSIINKAGQVGTEKSGPSQMSRNIYQSVLNISKKNKNFERLKPNETVGSMIEYNIHGTPDEIIASTQRITGKNGVLSNVVNNAVADVKTSVDMDDFSKVLKTVEESKEGRFSALVDDDFAKLNTRLNSIPQINTSGKTMGQRDLSAMLDFERTLQSEAQANRIMGMAGGGDTRAKELAELKFEVARDIGSIIDSKVNKAGLLEKYKDPRIVKELNAVSPKLAKDYLNAKTISEVRSLQKPFVRMSQIMELSMQEPSSLGRNLFRVGSQIPVVGPMLDSAAQSLAIPMATKAAVGLSKYSPNLSKILGF